MPSYRLEHIELFEIPTYLLLFRHKTLFKTPYLAQFRTQNH